MSELTRKAASFVSGLTFDDLPAGAADIVARGLIDCVGVMILGFAEPVTKIVAGVEALGPSGEATALWGGARARADVAALVNGTAAHALDYDDTGLDGHPSAVLVPALLAMGEAAGADGKRLVAAYVAGFEVWGDLASRDRDRHHGKGVHPTAAFGTVAAAAAAASLLRLDPERTSAALAIASSLAGGVMANFGTMTKPFQVGRAAQSGIVAARMAEAGMTAAGDALESRLGFLKVFSPTGAVDLEREPSFGRDWRILRNGISIKLNPACYAAHRIIDSTLALAGRGITAADIAAVDVRLGRTQGVLLRSQTPTNALDARFSAEFVVASTLLEGHPGLREFSHDHVNRPEVQTLMRSVRRVVSEEADPEDPLFSPADQVVVQLRDGTTLEGPAVRHARGHMQNPVGPDVLRRKFDECAATLLAPAEAAALFDKLADPARLRSVADLYRRDVN
jgi:2-methylcitrate dehydratase PrpD